MAANHRPKFLYDLDKWDAVLRVECRRCPHYALFEPREMQRHFFLKSWGSAWAVLGDRFRCRKCGVKGGTVSMAPRPALPGGLSAITPMTEAEKRRAAKWGR